MKLDIRPDDRVEVIEGSWAGRHGSVIHVPDHGDKVVVEFDDDPLRNHEVVACTLAKEVPDDRN